MKDRDTEGQVCILMGVYNGAADLPEQLASFAAQSHDNWQLIASDDGSTDDSPALLQAFAREQAGQGRQVTTVTGPGRGFVANFLSLLAAAPEAADWLALADQDDVWLPDRLARGIARLAPLPAATPALYCSATWIVDETLQNRRPSMEFRKPPEFRNALIQNIAPGNTILLNRAATDLIRASAPEAAAIPDLPAHDWWIYQMITGAGGTVFRDPEPTVLYRQHVANLIGANDTWRARAARIRMVLNGTAAAWSAANVAALTRSSDWLLPTHRDELQMFAAMREKPLVGRLRDYSRLGLYRQTLFGQAALWVSLLLGKL